MATTPRDRLDRERRKIDGLDLADERKDALRTFAKVLDTADNRHTAEDGDGAAYDCQPRTVESYLRCVRIGIERGVDPFEANEKAVNDLLLDLSDSRSDSTMVTYQAAYRAFYHVHDDLGVDPEALVTFSPDHKPRHDEQDMFTEDDVFDLRAAIGRTDHPTRNRALFELLVYTGQRIRAIVTLRIEDVDLDAGCLYLNDEVDGLKGALQRGRKRPLFGSRKYVREWVQARNEDEGWLFVGDPGHWRTAEGDHLAETSVDQMLRRVRKAAGVDKPVNPHNFRHYTATVLRRDYGLDWEEINALLGVVEGSNMPQTTYSHIDDSRLMRNIEVAMGYAEDDERNRFAPPACPTCGEVLKAHWRSCPACREVFAPDAQDIGSLFGERSARSDDRLEREILEVARKIRDGRHGESSAN